MMKRESDGTYQNRVPYIKRGSVGTYVRFNSFEATERTNKKIGTIAHLSGISVTSGYVTS